MHERICIHPVCFPDASFRTLAENWRKLEAHRVGLLSQHLNEEGLSAVQDAVISGGHKVETINHVFLPHGRHLERDERSWQEPRETLSRVIDESRALGANSVYIMSGGRGALTWEEAAECFARAIAPCVAQAKAAGVALLIEDASPLYAEIHLAHNLRDTLTLAEIANIGVCIDLFACWTEAGLKETIESAMPRCHLVQVCDYVYGDRSLPSRAVPGDGVIPITRLTGWILDAGYKGAFDLELLGPRIDKEGRLVAVKRAADYVGEILRSLGA
jgi:sugar phosphate isomerase/epimerase